MFALLVMCSNLSTSDVDKLGADSFAVRESAQWRLKHYGILAAPAIFRATRSDDPEIRHRANELAAPWRCWLLDLEAAAVLRSPWPVNPNRLWEDGELRYHLRRVAVANGCPDTDARFMVEGNQSGFWSQWNDADYAAWSLDRCRQRLGTWVLWPAP